MKAFAPNGAEIIGTCDMIPGNALISNFTRLPDGSLELDWVGETEVCWDGQETKTDARGQTIYVDDNGNEWPEDQVSLEGEELRPTPAAFGPSAPDLARLVSALATFVAMPDDPERAPEHMTGMRISFAELRAVKAALAGAAPPSAAPARAQVFVAIYENRSGDETRVFSSAGDAEAWRREIAGDNWAAMLSDSKPTDPEEVADEYFHRVGERGSQFFRVEECSMEGAGIAAHTPLSQLWTVTTDGDECPLTTTVHATEASALERVRNDLRADCKAHQRESLNTMTAEELREAWEAANDGACIIESHDIPAAG